jgi:hypothetical protein
MNAVITQTVTKRVLIDEDVLLKQLGIDPNKERITEVTLGHGSHFQHGGTAVAITLVEKPDSDRKCCR